MNSTHIRRTAATLAAAVLALGTLSASPADAKRPSPEGGRTTSVGSSTVAMDVEEFVTMLKVQRAQYLIDHPWLLR